MDIALFVAPHVDARSRQNPQEMTNRELEECEARIKEHELRHGFGPRSRPRLVAANPPERRDG
jgi:hypothetical protein